MKSVGKLKCLPFRISIVWLEQMNNHDDFYFCMTNVPGVNKKFNERMIYPNFTSHSDGISILVTLETWKFHQILILAILRWK